MNIKFNIEKKGDTGIIFLIANFGFYETDSEGNKKYKYLKLSTGEKIKINLWDYKQQKCKIVRGFVQSHDINLKLDNYKNKLLNIYRRLELDGVYITPDILKEEFKKNGSEKESSLKLIEFAKKFKEDCDRSFETKKKYNTLINKLTDYEKHKRAVICFDDVNMQFYNDFIIWLKEQKYTTNTIGGYIKNIKVFMDAAFDKKLHNNSEYKHKKFKVVTEDTDAIYLTNDEIMSIYRAELGDSLGKFRDLFVLCCYTGLRYSDLKTLKPANFTEQYLIKRTIKTNEKVVIPLHRIVVDILNKYNYQLPKVCSQQKYNDYLKKIGKKAEIKTIVIVSKTEGYEKVIREVEKWELITSHTARRSAATNMILSGIHHQAVMKFTGHKTIKSFMRYLKMSSEDNAELLKGHSYFK